MPPTHLTAQQRLWAAVLDNAVMSLEQRGIFNYGKYCNIRLQKRKARDESLTWLKSDLTTPGSFIFICDTLDINPDFLRARLFKEFASVPWNAKAKGEPLRTRSTTASDGLSREDMSNRMKGEDTMPKISKARPRHPEEPRKEMHQQHEQTKQARQNRMHEAKKRQEAKRVRAEHEQR